MTRTGSSRHRYGLLIVECLGQGVHRGQAGVLSRKGSRNQTGQRRQRQDRSRHMRLPGSAGVV